MSIRPIVLTFFLVLVGCGKPASTPREVEPERKPVAETPTPRPPKRPVVETPKPKPPAKPLSAEKDTTTPRLRAAAGADAGALTAMLDGERDAHVLRAILFALQRRGAAEAARPAVRKLFAHTDGRVRVHAARLAWSLDRDNDALAVLRKTLGDRDPAVVTAALRGLELCGDAAKEAARDIVPLLDHKELHDPARRALARLGVLEPLRKRADFAAKKRNADAETYLLLAPPPVDSSDKALAASRGRLSDTEYSARLAAGDHLGRCGPRGAAIVLAAVKDGQTPTDGLHRAAKGLRALLVADLVALLRADDLAMRGRACAVLAATGEAAAPAVGPLVAILDDPVRRRRHAIGAVTGAALPAALPSRDPCRREACEVLAAIGPKAAAAVPALRAALREEALPWAACQALGAIGPAAKDAVADLIDLLTQEVKGFDRNRAWRRQAAAMALGGIGPDAGKALPDLERLLGRESHSDAKAAMAQALAHIGRGSPEARPYLIKALAHESAYRPWVRLQLVRALAPPGAREKEAIPALLQVLRRAGDDQLRRECLRALAQLSDNDRRTMHQAVLKTLVNFDQDVPWAWASLGKPIVPALIDALDDPEPDPNRNVRRHAVVALGRLKGDAADAVPKLREHLKKYLDKKQGNFLDAGLIAYALGEIGPAAKEALPELIALLKSRPTIAGPSPGQVADDRVGALHGIAGIGPAAKSATPDIIDALPDQRGTFSLHRHGWGATVGAEAAHALRSIDPDPAVVVPALLKLLGQKNNEAVAAAALGRLGGKARDALPELRKRDATQAVWQIAGEGDFVRRTLDRLSAPAALERWRALYVLKELFGEEDVLLPYLADALEDRDAGVRAIARLWVNNRAALAPFLAGMLFEPGAAVLDDLVRMGESARVALPALRRLSPPEWSRRCEVLLARWRIGQEADAIAELIALLDTDGADLASITLGKIGPAAKAALPALRRHWRMETAAAAIHAIDR